MKASDEALASIARSMSHSSSSSRRRVGDVGRAAFKLPHATVDIVEYPPVYLFWRCGLGTRSVVDGMAIVVLRTGRRRGATFSAFATVVR